jgi:hypothetical protein
MVRALTFIGAGMLLVALAAGCYYSPKTRAAKADPSFMSEAEVEVLVQRKLAQYGIKFIPNMKLQRGEVMFVADGYDRDIRVGYEYRSHEGLDFEGESGQSEDGLTNAEIEFLTNRQKVFREYFLIIPESNREGVENAVDAFGKDLYTWEVLKKAKKKQEKKDSLFPEDDKKKNLLPWEATGDLKKKRKEMEAKEELDGKPKPGGEDLGGEDWGIDSGDSGKKKKGLDDDEWGGGSGDAKKDKDKDKDKEKKTEEKDEWGGDEEDEEDF